MSTSDIFNFIDKYSITVGNTVLQPIMLAWVAFLMCVLCLVRSFSVVKMSKVQLDSASKWYIFSVESLCWLFGSVVSILLICVSSNPNNYIVNGIVFPILGFLSSLWFEGVVITRMNKTVLDKYENKDKEKEKPSKKSNILDKLVGDRATSPVIINIDNAGRYNTQMQEDGSHKYQRKLKTLQDMLKEPTEDDYITEEDIQSEQHNKIFMDAINDLKDGQYSQAVELKRHLDIVEGQSEELKSQSAILISVRDTMMIDKKFKLKKMIYDCLNQGFVRPEQNDVITADYKSYLSLGGNGEIQELYEKHYLNLQVHEDRRIAQSVIPIERRVGMYLTNVPYNTGYDDGDKIYMPPKK